MNKELKRGTVYEVILYHRRFLLIYLIPLKFE